MPVRVSSINALPLGNLVPLVSEEVRLALAFAWADAVSKNETAAATVYEDMARSIKVKFELEPDEDEGMLMKWTSAIKVKQIANNVQLVGIRRGLEVSAVANMLKRRGVRATSKNVETWFKKAQGQLIKGGGEVSEDTALNAKTIELQLRVTARLAVTLIPSWPWSPSSVVSIR